MNDSTIGERATKALLRRSIQKKISFHQECLQVFEQPYSCYSWKKRNPSAYSLALMAKAGYDIYWILTGEKKDG